MSTLAAVGVGGLVSGAAPVGAFDVSSSPCSLISNAKLAKDLGLAHSYVQRAVIGAHYPTETDGQVASNCNRFVWSGSKPKTSQQFQQKLANGTGALLYIRTWITDASSPDAYKWKDNGFQSTLGNTITACSNTAKALHGHTVTLPRDGAQNASGYQYGVGAGTNLCGVWDRYDTHRIIDLILEESKQKPAVKQLKKIAQTAVTAFL